MIYRLPKGPIRYIRTAGKRFERIANPRIRSRVEWLSPSRGRQRSGFAGWLSDMGAKNGVYAIRDAETHEILYVGESHRGHLKKTLTRHFQRWAPSEYAPIDTSGPTYDRRSVEVAFSPAPASAAQRLQFRLIRKLSPRDNVYTGTSTLGDGGEVPF